MPALLVAFIVAFLVLVQLMRLDNVTTLLQGMEAQMDAVDSSLFSNVRPPNDQKSNNNNETIIAAFIHSNLREGDDEDAMMIHTSSLSPTKTFNGDIGNRTRTTRVVVKEPLPRPPLIPRNISDRTETDTATSTVSNSSSSIILWNATLLLNNNNEEEEEQEQGYYNSRTVPLIEPPNHNNTIISMISMGRGPDTFLVERCIRSIRKSGGFTGYIMVYTVPKGWTRYHQTLLSWDSKVILMLGRDEDLEPTTIDGTKIPYRQKKMAFKRFKTLLIDYLAYDPRVDADKTIIQHILYLDIDNVIANTLDPFFEDYYALLLQGMMKEDYYDASHSQQRENNDRSDDDTSNKSLQHTPPTSFVYVYSDYGKPVWHTGIMMYHRHYAVGCLEAWRRVIDTKWKQVSDQKLLLIVFQQSKNNVTNSSNNNKKINCKPMRLPGGHFTFAKHGDLKKSKNPSTIIHITDSTRAKMFPQDLMDAFLKRVLQLQPNETMVGNITWDEVLPIRVMHR
jgi:hypothetical protein